MSDDRANARPPSSGVIEATLAGDKSKIRTGSGPQTVRAIAGAIRDRILPDTYVTDGQLVHVERVSGAGVSAAGDEDSPLPLAASTVTSPLLARMLAEHTYTFKVRRDKDDLEHEEECLPPPATLSAALARTEWPDVPPLLGIIGAPVLRRDGTLLQTPGYDPASMLYLAKKVPLDPVPEKPTAEQVASARSFILDRLLHDFVWVSPADRANYLGLMVTQILRPYTRSLTPFGLIDATMPGSGKTILTAGIGMLYGQRVLSWTDSNEELRKAITSVLAEQVGAVVFDNIAEGVAIDSPILARLITERTWADRRLGGNTISHYPNDRLWLATGNNLRLGGDMVTRTVLVQLDPGMPNPEQRTGFAIPQLDQWILNPANQRTVLWNLLVLVVDWCNAGAPRSTHVMRQFTAWAQAVGGFLSHHGVEDFLANAGLVRDIDDEDATWTAFLGRWYRLLGNKWVTTNELRQEAEVDLVDGYRDDPWQGLFLTDQRGRVPSVVSLGKRLQAHVGRFHGTFVLRSAVDRHDKIKTWQVEELPQGGASGANS